jgi:very-short-patch-repair endonuclease
LSFLSLKEIEVKYSFPIVELKRRKLNKIKLPTILYSISKLKEIISLYDVNNQGFPKQIINDDINVYNSIIEHTKNHILESDKITEKIYRLLNDYEPKYIPRCKETKEILKFYTISKGYGNSDLNLTRKGFTLSYDFSCHSNVSQKLFWEIYNILDADLKSEVKFAQLNGEKKIHIQESELNKNLNKYHFSLDFCMNNKNIEFDGEYWHSIENIKEKDMARDKYLNSLNYKILRIKERDYYNNPNETLNRCIEFLKS